MRKGHVYGTVLVDVETRRPIDLLPDREASTLAKWLAKRPGIEVVCRDRAPFFAEGATAGAPQAVQVADRWHLWHNLGEAAERCVADHRACLRGTAPEPPCPVEEPNAPTDSSGSPWPTGHRFADRTRANHAAVHALLAAGHSRRTIQCQLGMTYRTVKLLADATAPEDLFRGQWQGRPPCSMSTSPTWTIVGTKAAPTRGRHGRRSCRSATRAATSELAPTSAPSASRQIQSLRHRLHLARSPAGSSATPTPSPRGRTAPPQGRPVHCPELDALTGHVRSFAEILTERLGQRLPAWLDAVRNDNLPGLHSLAAGIDRDRDAVIAGLTLPWNSGVAEGHVNRIKMLKRQMFGRAGFPLLRKRVLLYR
ncbi:transposase [Streptomyces sp. NPDC059095]|uniref:transposase n=1 Tax=Streptomyces sp. NPDC059095 TaxID=3346726 RepID=UPI0036828F9A